MNESIISKFWEKYDKKTNNDEVKHEFDELEADRETFGRANIKRKEIGWKAADRKIIKTMNSKEYDKAAVNDKGLTKVEEYEAKFENVDVSDVSKISTIWITRPDNDCGKFFCLLFKDQTQGQMKGFLSKRKSKRPKAREWDTERLL